MTLYPKIVSWNDMKLIMCMNILDNYHNLQQNIERFTNWCKINDMNPTKCKKITFKRKRQYIVFNKCNILNC